MFAFQVMMMGQKSNGFILSVWEATGVVALQQMCALGTPYIPQRTHLQL